MKKYIPVFFLLFVCAGYAQLKEFTLSEMPAPTQFPPIMRSHPDDGTLILYSSVPGLVFDSNNNTIDDIKEESGKYTLFLKPETQIITVKKPGYIESKFPLMTVKSKEARYFKVEEKSAGLAQLPVNIITTPQGAIIYLDGNLAGTTSQQKLTPGVHTLILEKTGFKRIEMPIEVSENKTLFSYTLQKIEQVGIQIQSIPQKAQILLDDVDRGLTNRALFLYPETHRLKLQLSGYTSIDTVIEVKDTPNQVFSFHLNKNSVELSIDVSPADASVMIDREDYTGQQKISLPLGKHLIELQKEGYQPQSENVEISETGSITKKYILQALTGKLQFAVYPLEAEVELSDESGQVKSWKGLKIIDDLHAGTYTLRCRLDGYLPISKTIIIKHDETTAEDISLQAAEKESGGISWYVWTGGAIIGGAAAIILLKPKTTESIKTIPSPPGRPTN